MPRPIPFEKPLEKSRRDYIGRIIREIRMKQGMTARELARRVGVDPRLINAIEMGRIRNPSLDRLSDIATAIGLNLSQLLTKYETRKPGNFSEGGAQGEFMMDFPNKGFRLISYTVPIKEMFCGKMILDGKKSVDKTKFPMAVLIFIQVIIGKMIVNYQGDDMTFKEGQSFLLNGRYEFAISNPAARATSFLLVTTPAPWGQSFFQP